MKEVQGVVEVAAMKEVQGVVEVAAMKEVQGVVEVAAMEEVQGVVEVHAMKEMVQEQEMVRKTYSNPTSTCEVCIHPALCLKCGIRGEASIFLCSGCRLPVPKDLRSCTSCGNPCLCDNYWCKDCAITAAINKDGICIRCRRNPSIYLEEEKKAHNVPDSQV
ncbi:hypothetical protein CFC21_103623 [Triticum aestivum]|uniref:Uncharacterized protein n=3 Tax=Triticum TaxID=4564 RepID=A0A9R1A4B3_TRITD|nr:hypothetical protein CFC21_103623 [Triticum aestivum]VAI89302.1 unnamed protein product [Triticum turgidum subsp. durum]